MRLENGQIVKRDRALFRVEGERTFVDRSTVDYVKVYFYENEEVLGSFEKKENFLVFIRVEKSKSISDKFKAKIGDLVVEVERVDKFEFKICKILKGGFVKSGNDVYIC